MELLKNNQPERMNFFCLDLFSGAATSYLEWNGFFVPHCVIRDDVSLKQAGLVMHISLSNHVSSSRQILPCAPYSALPRPHLLSRVAVGPRFDGQV